MPVLEQITSALSRHLPAVVRWSGAIARQLRQHNVAVIGKTSGSANTDALTLADLTVQELIVSALRDCDPIFQQCRIEAEEGTGDLGRFPDDAEYTIAIDPIDGTLMYRDKSGDGYGVIVLLRSAETVHWSLVFLPESGPQGTWVHAVDDRVVCGPDDPARPADEVLRELTPVKLGERPQSKKVYLIGFQNEDPAKAQAVSDAGLEGYAPADMPGSIYELLAKGEFVGSLIHSPNVYDFPVSLQIARILGGDAVWVHSGEPVNFEHLWLDDRADMFRLPDVVACSHDRKTLAVLCNLAKDWDRRRYRD